MKHETILLAIFFAPLMLLGGQAIKTLESAFFPVAGGFEHTIVSREEDSTTYRVFGEKYRSCTLRSISAYVEEGDIQVKLPPIKFSDGGEVSSRPAGKGDFGQWTVFYGFLEEKPTEIEVIVEHSCGFPWTQLTSLGKWTV